jgi:hypothetical protein
MSLSNTVEHEMLLDFVIRHPALWLALSITDPSDDGSTIDEPSGGGYTRMLVGDVTITGNELTNDVIITFPTSTANWGTINYGALFDDEVAGVFLGSGVVSATPVPIDTSISIPAGTVLLTMD